MARLIRKGQVLTGTSLKVLSMTWSEYQADKEALDRYDGIIEITDRDMEDVDADDIAYSDTETVGDAIERISSNLSAKTTWRKIAENKQLGSVVAYDGNATEYMFVVTFLSVKIVLPYLRQMGIGTFYQGFYSASNSNGTARINAQSTITIDAFYWNGSNLVDNRVTFDVYCR